MRKLVIMLIRLYQKYFSSNTNRVCRFYPTCSQYSIEAITKYGLFKGGFMSIKRIIKCNPFNPGGYDPLK